MSRILTNVPASLEGLCDVLVEVETDCPRILQLTDMQIIDSAQRRTPDRISEEEIAYWSTERAKENCYDHIRDLVAQTHPDLIIVTGDMVYGEFDDSGRIQREFSDLLGSFGIPWAPVFGNHDNESRMGIDWQCALYTNAPNSLFQRGNCTGNGNYSVGLVHGERLLRVLYMLDSHGCGHPANEELKLRAGIYPDQLAWIETAKEAIRTRCGDAPALAAYHIPTPEFAQAELEKYGKERTDLYTLGVGVAARDGDFGAKYEKYRCGGEASLIPFWKRVGVDGVFIGHCHKNNFSVLYEGVRLTFGLKTGAYDYYTNGQLGATLIRTASDGSFEVSHVTTLVPYEPLFPM
ncbi:MAG: metallophosphoesterase [Clostridia bacterium]|nr:metallophosphoesterase [Clostridia bacterium]